MTTSHFVHAAALPDLRSAGCLSVSVEGHTLALYLVAGQVYAVDNRCPHMGFPLDRGHVQDGILTCYWHYARFDLQIGGTFDQWADDVRVFPAELRGDEVWVDVARHSDPQVHQRERLKVGLERNISLVIGKAVLVLLEGNGDPVEPFRIGLEFGAKYRQRGWGQGLTMLTCFMNLLPYLDAEDRPRALYHGLAAVAQDTANNPPRFPVRPLPGHSTDIPTLKRWFRQFIEVRDDEGAERCVVSALQAGADDKQMADMFFAAATDHRYLTIGHVADFTNKAFEALDIAGWACAEPVLTSLVTSYAMADRMEEANSWRYPVDLVTLVEKAFAQLLEIAEKPGFSEKPGFFDPETLVPTLLGDNPQAIVDGLVATLGDGATMHEVAGMVTLAAARRIAQFHTSNEFGDWDTALHTFTFANAIQMGLRRAPSVELLRGVFDAAMSVYLDRFLNIPAARIPQGNGHAPDVVLATFPGLLNQQQQVNPAGQLVADYLHQNGTPTRLQAMLGKLLLREDRDFHTIQTVEAAFNQYRYWQGTGAANQVLIAAARYLGAHAPTMRAQGQTYQIAQRLHRGERLFEG